MRAKKGLKTFRAALKGKGFKFGYAENNVIGPKVRITLCSAGNQHYNGLTMYVETFARHPEAWEEEEFYEEMRHFKAFKTPFHEIENYEPVFSPDFGEGVWGDANDITLKIRINK